MSDVEKKAWGPWAVGIAGLLALCLLLYWASTLVKSGGTSAKRQTVKIAVLPDTPPPPPPKVEKPPEPEKQETKPQPQQEQPKVQQASPEPQQLKMDGPAGDGPSAFASGQVSSEYKGGDIGTGGGAVNRMQFAFFTGRLTRHIQTELARDKGLKGQDYRINVRIWVGDNGLLQRFELLTSTGNEMLDASLKQALATIAPLDQVPANLPQPLTLRITNRVTG